MSGHAPPARAKGCSSSAVICAAKQKENPPKCVQADLSSVRVELETGMVCFN